MNDDMLIENILSEYEDDVPNTLGENAQELVDYISFNPAQYFSLDKCYIAVKMRSVSEDNKLKDQIYIITSDREKFIFDDKFKIQHKFYSDKYPSVESRWANINIINFLECKETGNISPIIDIVDLLKLYCDFEDELLYSIVAYWILATYFYQLFNSFPYISLTGNPGCGKTKLLNFIALTSFNGELFTSSSSTASIKRLIHDNSITCCVDEVESLAKANDTESKDVMAMYNSGYKKGATVNCCESKGKSSVFIVKRFDCYSPKVFAGIKGLDLALSTRCIPIVMLRSANKRLVNSEIDLVDPIWAEIRNKCYLFMLKNWKDVRSASKNISDDELEGRDWEIWKPIMCLVDILDPSLSNDIKKYILTNIKNVNEEYIENMTTPKILRSFEAYFIKENKFEVDLTVDEIIEILNLYDPDLLSRTQAQSKIKKWIGSELKKAGLSNGSKITRDANNKVVRTHTIRKEVVDRRLKPYS